MWLPEFYTNTLNLFMKPQYKFGIHLWKEAAYQQTGMVCTLKKEVITIFITLK